MAQLPENHRTIVPMYQRTYVRRFLAAQLRRPFKHEEEKEKGEYKKPKGEEEKEKEKRFFGFVRYLVTVAAAVVDVRRDVAG